MKLGAIDIGSNAVRLLIADVSENNTCIYLKKESLTRVPVRLGEDVFSKGEILEDKQEKLFKSLQAFKNIMEVVEVKDYAICATSAMREAKNGADLVKRVKKELGMPLKVISGDLEADLICSTFSTGNEQKKTSFLYIDVGGGSTEITLIRKGEKEASKSFKLGTVRLLSGKVKDKTWEEMDAWLKALKIKKGSLMAIGSGGNINKMVKLCKSDPVKKTIDFTELYRMTVYLKDLSMEERMRNFSLREDRADVIVPASEIYLHIMELLEIKEIKVPKVGLADGLVYNLFLKKKGNRRFIEIPSSSK